MHLIVKNRVGYCTVTFVWGWKIVCVQESCLFIYIVYSTHCQVDTTESLAGASIVPTITKFVSLSDLCSKLWHTSAIILKAGTCMYILSNNSHTFTDTNLKFTA